jgi:hypothetical protein
MRDGSIRMKTIVMHALLWLLVAFLAAPPGLMAQGSGAEPEFSQEELDALVAPIALYPDALLAQVLMAATYPLDVVQAARWVKANPNLRGDQLAAALEQQNWDPSVKSLVNFPSVLQMMNDKLDWTQRLGDAVLAQENDVMNAVQRLRHQAQASGNLETTSEQQVIVEPQTQYVVIQPANPQVIYVPTYDPTVVYGAWPYPAYPPYAVYPPEYVATAVFSFVAGVAIGAAWGYAWGGCNWGHSDINVNVWRNQNINNNINRNYYASKITTSPGGRGRWRHNPENRRGVAYRDQGTAQKFGRQGRPGAAARRDYRGFDQVGGTRPGQGMDRQAIQQRPATGGFGRQGVQQRREASGLGQQASARPRDTSVFSGYDRGNQTRNFSNRGNQSLASQRPSGGVYRGASGTSGGGGGGAPRAGGVGGGRVGGR